MLVSGAQQWWKEWQLRILVLGSLFVQFLLYFSAAKRKHAIPSWIRSITQITYIGGDALAIYAFATLFNRQKEHIKDGGSSALELLWAPILLIHLGGQTNITAYNLEDSKLWKRHAVIVVSKVTLSLYVFIMWFSDERLKAAAVILLIIGIAKFIEKPFFLWRGSYGRLVSSIIESARSEVQHEFSLKEYVQRANSYIHEPVEAETADRYLPIRFGEFGRLGELVEYENNFRLKMLADLPASYSGRLRGLQCFVQLDDRQAYDMLQLCHGHTFQFLYVKNKLKGFLGMYIHYSLPFTGLSAITSFIRSNKDGYNVNDVWVTYILLCCTTIIEILSSVSLGKQQFTSWHRMVPQYKLMSFCALRKKPTILMKLATFKCIQKYLHEHWYAGQVPVALLITKLVRQQVRDGWNMYIHDVGSYRVFNNCRGQWTVHRLVSESDHRQRFRQSLKVPFDESVLLWHIATDLCFHHTNTSAQGRQRDATECSRVISSYMFYLLAIRPEMLMPGTRPDLSTVASDDVDRILKNSNAQIDSEEMLAQEIMTATTRETGTRIPDACRLAETLMELGDEKKRWRVIQGVWVEMLCYSAARCRGYLHAKSLGDGGEYLSYVWLLWAFMGMETLAEKIHRPEPPGEEEITAAGALASPSQGGVDQTVEIHMPKPPGEDEISAAGALASPFQRADDQTVEIHMPEPPGEDEMSAACALASPSQGEDDQTVDIVSSPACLV